MKPNYLESDTLKSVFSESSTFSQTIFDFLVRLSVILLSDQGAHMKLQEI